MHKIGQSRGFLCRLFRPLLKTAWILIENVVKPLPKRVLIPLGLTAAASAKDAAIHNKLFGSSTCPSDLPKQTTLIISNKKMNDIMKRSLDES